MRALQVCVWVLLFWSGQGAAAVTCVSLPETLDPVVKEAARSVVTVRVAYEPSPGATVETHGSGVILDTHGHVVTAAHVLSGFRHVLRKPGMRYTVVSSDCHSYTAELLPGNEEAGFSPDTALLKITTPPHDLVPARVGSSHAVRTGDRVFAVGSPNHTSNAVMPGEVLAVDVLFGELPVIPLIHASTRIDVGASGGALFNSSGQVIGLTSRCLGSDTGGAGFVCVRDGFFVPIDLVMKFTQPFMAKVH